MLNEIGVVFTVIGYGIALCSHTSTQNHFTASTLLNESVRLRVLFVERNDKPAAICLVNLFRVSPVEVTFSLSLSDFSFVGDYCLGELWRSLDR